MHNPITLTVTPSGQERSLTINLTELLERLQTVPDQRKRRGVRCKRRGVRYPLAVLLAIAVLAKLCGQSQVHALAHWAHERASELSTVFALKRARMPHPTTWTRVLGNAVAAAAIEAALQPLLVLPSAEVPERASRQIALDGKTLRGTIPSTASSGVHLLTA